MKTVNVKLILLPALILLAPGCFWVDHNHHGCVGDQCGVTTGDIQFFWGFELAAGTTTDNCAVADVARIDLWIYNDLGNLEYSTSPDRPCGDLGAVITDFWPGYYQIEIEGICPTGAVTHQGVFDIEVYEGQINDYGTLTLDYLAPCI
jgi:hypothetical protein